MDKLQRLLDYIHITNPDMTMDNLIKELGECKYSALSLIYTERHGGHRKGR